MSSHVALVRAINVGGTGKLAMRDLREICEGLGLENPVTYIQSGNVVFESKLREAQVKQKLEKALAKKLGKPVAVLIRGERELAAALEHNPFSRADPKRVLLVFLDRAPDGFLLGDGRRPGGEELVLLGRELFIHFPKGMGASRLVLPFRDVGTGRNLNTVRKLFELLRDRRPKLGSVERPSKPARK